ncbi:MAG TPA: galactose oxidase-like domain-containing protein [Vicinamibacterales bacterium]|nr:galactose oxidase-like domain-containing protein [Vicinamibacterales bacterium]
MRAHSVGGPVRSLATSTSTKWLAGVALLFALVIAGSPRVRAQASLQGQWTTLPYLMPINPVHPTVLNNGRVLIVSGSGNVATETTFRSTIWDPQAGTFNTRTHAYDMFCNGMVVMPDGRVLINGGNLAYDPFRGHKKNTAYDPATDTFTAIQDMAHGRWYPTPTVLGDGSVMTFSGLNDLDGATNTAVEIYTPGSGWSPEYLAGWTPPLYPRMHLITDGRVFYSGSGRGSRFFNPSTKTWTSVVATTNYSGTRTYGTSVLLPLSGANGYKSRVMIFGGGNPATNTTEIIDLSAPTPQWQWGPPMSQGRIEMNATILPNGKVLVMGGSVNDEDAATASLNADLYDPKTNTFSSAGANTYPRLYHSGSVLLPDGTVALMGGNPTRGSYEQHIEIYSPAYLFNGDGSPATRPTITSAPGSVTYASAFDVQTPDAGQIGSAVLVRPGSQTHAFDMDQRLIELSFTSAAGVITATAPPHGNVAPPGYYMLFILNSAGVPSVARMVRLSADAPANQAPTATIISPSSNVTVNPGGSVSFAGSGSDPDGSIASYAWSFAGGNPATSTVATPGAVVYSTPGSYTASLKVTDDKGAVSPSTGRTITVADFSLSATPNSRSVLPGAGTSYAVTVASINGFTGAVSFDGIGLPSGATASFTPGSVTGSGSTTLAVSTSASTPPGTYTLTINGTSGPITRSTNVTLVIAGDFSLSVSPTSQNVSRGGNGTYTVSVVPGSGFTGNVTLSVGSLPRFVTTRFSTGSITASTTSVLTLDTKKNVSRGTYSIMVSGTSNGVVRTVPITLTVQ